MRTFSNASSALTAMPATVTRFATASTGADSNVIVAEP